jgi:hypothetical protein
MGIAVEFLGQKVGLVGFRGFFTPRKEKCHSVFFLYEWKKTFQNPHNQPLRSHAAVGAGA